MASDRPRTTRRAFLATGALVLGAGCSSTSNVSDDPATTTAPTTTEAPTETSTPEPTEEPETEETETDSGPTPRTEEQPANVNPAYQGTFTRHGRMVDNVEDLSRWGTANGGTLVADIVTKFSGTQSMHFEGTGRSVIYGDFEDDPIDLSDSDVSLAMNFHEPSNATAVYLIAQAPDPDNLVMYKRFLNGKRDIGWERQDLAPTSVVGDPDLSEVTRLLVSVVADDGQPVSFHLDDIRAHPKPEKAKVIFRFDDTQASHYDDYYPVLNEYGYPGIEAVVQTNVAPSRLSHEKLQELQSSGWDLCNHTTKHQNITELSEAELRADIEEMDEWFADHDMAAGDDMHILTYGAYDGASIDVLSEHFDLVFGGGSPTNYNLTNPMSVGSFDAEHGIEATKDMIDDVVEHQSLLVLMFHNKYSREEFAEIVDYVAANDDKLDVISGSDLRDHLASLE
ncbi:polysaccharide deacetylase family protein [Halomarina litorea]|uniref:polysaccharide deacetylase family protein n=1 Tax=Halomarina litorea TaxID=2961595 RepID=UPI0020C449C9|nr:polysaccharide deacetylase family protein [Halomarina sp. BCD28]